MIVETVIRSMAPGTHSDSCAVGLGYRLVVHIFMCTTNRLPFAFT